MAGQQARSVSLKFLVSGLVAFGAISISMVVYSQRLISRDFEQNAAMVRLVQTVQQEIATAHLWFEEALGGDATIDVDEQVHRPIRQALATIRSTVNPAVNIDSPTIPLPTIRPDLESLRDSIAALDQLVDSRWRGRDSSGVIGGEEDQVFDDLFLDILGMSRGITDEIDLLLAQNQRKILAINVSMLLVLIVLFSAVCALVIWNRRALEARATELEDLVRQRTASLEAREAEALLRNEELALARDQANAASEAKSQFLANMSHEIRTPMNGVVGMASLLARTQLSELQKEYVETMHKSGLKLLKIINEVLDFAKIEAGKVTLEAEDFSLRASIGDVLHLFSAEASRKNLVLRSTVNSDVPDCLRGDPGRLGQVFSNLVSNAIKFSENGAIVLSCRRQTETDDGTVELLFEVSDPGVGIAEKHQARLFEQFSQVDASSTREHGGTGLGLAICKEIVDLLGGRIGVRSAPGEGSTFWFTARLSAGDPNNIRAAQKALQLNRNASDSDATGSDRSPWAHVDRKLLVVDDNEVNLLVARRMLEELGFEVDTAVNGREAVAAACDYEYAAILIDCQMPGMDGNEATSIIRKAESGKRHTPIIALTANVMVPDRELAFDAGVDDYLSKPVFLEDLHAVLSRVLAAEGRGPIRVVSSDLRPVDPSLFPVVDPTMVEELRAISGAGDADLFSELAELFLDQMPGWLEDIRDSAESGNTDSVRRQAHKLLGLCRQIGAQRMARICDEIESTRADTINSDLLRRVNMLIDEFDSTDRVLRDRFLT